MQFLYFIPDRTNAPPEVLAELGIAAVLGCPAATGYIDAGPSGAGGVLVAASVGPPTALAFRKDRWRWIPRHDAAEPAKVIYHLGVPQPPPGPEDLARPEMLAGKAIILADGREWIVPLARYYDGGTPLGRRVTLDEAGNEVLGVLEARRGLWEAACEVWEEFVAQQALDSESQGQAVATDRKAREGGMTLLRAKQIASMALGANYRVGEFEVSALGLLSTENIHAALAAMADVDGFCEMLKKKRADGA
jgi:hypothetical protein